MSGFFFFLSFPILKHDAVRRKSYFDFSVLGTNLVNKSFILDGLRCGVTVSERLTLSYCLTTKNFIGAVPCIFTFKAQATQGVSIGAYSAR